MEWFKYAESSISDGSSAITYRTADSEDVEVIAKTKIIFNKKQVGMMSDGKPLFEVHREEKTEYIVADGESLTSHAIKEEAFAYAESILNKSSE